MSIAAFSPIVSSFAAPTARPQPGERGSGVKTGNTNRTEGKSNTTANDAPVKINDKSKLSDEALALIGKLKARDTEVRQHEAAHLAAAGSLATSGASFTYERGPDGVNYAIGGEVGIDVSPGRTPEETIERARIVQAAALAPAEPSGPDLAVAAQAQQLEQEARGELARQQSAPATSQQDQKANVNRAYGVDGKASANSGALSVYA